MIRIRTASRLHFGLLAPAATTGRRFGGLGVMVRDPSIDITMSQVETWSMQGPLAERGRKTLQRLRADPLLHTCPPLLITVHEAPLEHQGLGTGTQFDLALARGLAAFVPNAPTDTLQLAALVGRGVRSAIGTHGFAQGGFLVDGGKRQDTDAPAPLLLRLPFPEDWRILLLRPLHEQGPAGLLEREKFLTLQTDDPARTATLRHLALMEILPALMEKNFPAFSASIHEFNRQAGELFRSVQGSVYTHPRTERLVSILRDLGILGVGQSSWGPTVFAFAENEGVADMFRERLRLVPETADHEVIVTMGMNHGAEILYPSVPGRA